MLYATTFSSKGAVNEGQPVPESNFSLALNNRSPQQTQV
ncbi:hypothetical protein VHA_000895 [Grimontia hollisae CIP 101886]|uniref:Uncharacterized protein n=1 Tax=Grimontia hollisae CIP 101886 TaxID=675812 RepID=D0I578_GRIHO|nr:hypothetical protein VHA_000895 [Grimontia hollisae CIP 101886]